MPREIRGTFLLIAHDKGDIPTYSLFPPTPAGFPASFFFFPGRHGSLTVHSSPIRFTTFPTHFSLPNGRSRFTLTRTRSNSFSSIRSFTIPTQFLGPPPGHSSNPPFTPLLPAALPKLDHAQSSARFTIF